MTSDQNAQAWGLPGVLDFYETSRTTTSDIYLSEWIFIKDCLREGISVLDVGCAQAGFANILAENLNDFSYTGIDISAQMIDKARQKHPLHRFHVIENQDYTPLNGQEFDLVLSLGILHLHEDWRDTIAHSWAHTKGSLILDLRESAEPTLEDKNRSYFRMDFGGGDARHKATHLPYNIINTSDALSDISRLCAGSSKLSQFGYRHPVSPSATTPVSDVMAMTYCIER